jgi:hypothetical protein
VEHFKLSTKIRQDSKESVIEICYMSISICKIYRDEIMCEVDLVEGHVFIR